MHKNIALKLVCIMVTGLPLTEKMANLLYKTAKTMLENDALAMQAANNECEGLVRTEFNRTHFNSFSGVIFNCKLATEKGTTEVEFLIRD